MQDKITTILNDFAGGKVKNAGNTKPLNTFRILILEDDLRTLSFLLKKLHLFEEELSEKKVGFDIAVTILSEYTQVKEYVNKKESEPFDVILLDRDCKICGSFHCLDFEKYGVDKIISISAVQEWNKQAQERGVKKVILKTHENIEDFSKKVIDEIRRRINLK